MPKRLPERPSLEQLHKQAKDLLREKRATDSSAKLSAAQFELAREYGFETWAALVHHVEALQPSALARFEQLAQRLADAYSRADKPAIRQINWDLGTSFVWYDEPGKMHERLKAWDASSGRTPELALAGGREIVAHSYGFESWEKFVGNMSQPEQDPKSAPVFLSSRPPFYRIDWKENRIEARGPQTERDWDSIFALVREQGITKISASGIPDSAMEELCTLDQVTHLQLGGVMLTDEGMRHLARMPQLEALGCGGWTSPITDRALEPLRYMKRLRFLELCWSQHISDTGLGNLAPCDLLEVVNLMGTPAGDGTLRALAGKAALNVLHTGRGVTDAGLPLLHELPVFKTWHGGEAQFDLMSFAGKPNHLLLDGPFTNRGLASLIGLDGMASLGFFWHCPSFTGAGLAPLRHLPRLAFLGCQDDRCDDEAMRYIAELPHLRMLMGQGAVASDAGFEALSRSQTLEHFWGRDCPNFGSRGFAAMASMPSLRGLAVSCKNVDDAALSALPRFPALRQLMPMDLTDDGFRHVGRCKLERLWCMYCRETGDIATEHIAGLELKSYYAGSTRITDRSLEILGRMSSLEELEFWQCAGLTNAGIAHLAKLSNLRKILLDGLSGVSRQAIGLFPPTVRVNYTG
jgi:hypothetical protein